VLRKRRGYVAVRGQNDTPEYGAAQENKKGYVPI
jgi:hypothetical protein